MNEAKNHALSIASRFKTWSDADKEKFVHYLMGEVDGEEKARKEISLKLKKMGISVPDSVFSQSAVT